MPKNEVRQFLPYTLAHRNMVRCTTYRDILDSKLDLSKRLLLVVVEIGEGEFDHSTLERVVGVFYLLDETPAIDDEHTQTLGSVDKGLSGVLVLEESRSLDVVPLCEVKSWLR